MVSARCHLPRRGGLAPVAGRFRLMTGSLPGAVRSPPGRFEPSQVPASEWFADDWREEAWVRELGNSSGARPCPGIAGRLRAYHGTPLEVGIGSARATVEGTFAEQKATIWETVPDTLFGSMGTLGRPVFLGGGGRAHGEDSRENSRAPLSFSTDRSLPASMPVGRAPAPEESEARLLRSCKRIGSVSQHAS